MSSTWNKSQELLGLERKQEGIFVCQTSEIVGRGTFGLTLLTEYRGTLVGVKRALPPNTIKKEAKPIPREWFQH